MKLLREYIRSLLTEAAKGPIDLPDNWVSDCSDLEPSCITNDTDQCGVCSGDGLSCLG